MSLHNDFTQILNSERKPRKGELDNSALARILEEKVVERLTRQAQLITIGMIADPEYYD